jgi:hypothetical protein
MERHRQERGVVLFQYLQQQQQCCSSSVGMHYQGHVSASSACQGAKHAHTTLSSPTAAAAAAAAAAGHGANIDVPREEDNRTPLHIAVNEGHADVVEALLEAGAKVGSGT